MKKTYTISSITLAVLLAFLTATAEEPIVNGSPDAQSAGATQQPLLYTVTDQNELAAVDVGTLSTTIIGVTRDTNSGPKRRIRGLAYDAANSILYGMTREGDLVTGK